MAAARDTDRLFRGSGDGREQTEARELRRFFCDFDAEIGFRSTFSAMIAAANGVGFGSGSPDSWDPYAERVEKLTAGARTRRALERVHGRLVVVLYRLYGPVPAHVVTGSKELGEHALIAPYTEAAEEARADLVVRRSAAHEAVLAEGVPRAHAISRTELEAEFWATAGRLLHQEGRIDWHERALRRDPENAKSKVHLEDARRRHRAYEQLLGQLLDGFRYDGTIRAQIGAIESADRGVSVDDAIHDRLSPMRPEHERAAFASAVKRQAVVLKGAAHEAYRVARDATRRERVWAGPRYDRDTRSWIW